MSSSGSDPRIGTQLLGYRIEELVGRGGMGVVYRAEHLGLGRKVALKLLSPELAETQGYRQRFMRESRMAARLEHPNILPVYEAGEAEGLLYIAMRYVQGSDLAKVLEREGRLQPQRAIDLLDQVARAVDAAHRGGLVHRDVKPANILIAPELGPGSTEHCYLCDFGLLKHFDSSDDLTSTGQFVGTIPYVAPEQIEGQALDGRVDVYALGCVLFQCLTGSVPYDRDSDVAIIYAHLQDPPPSAVRLRPELPPEFDELVARALAKAPEDRFATAAELVAAARTALRPHLRTQPWSFVPGTAAVAPAAGPAPPRVAPGVPPRPPAGEATSVLVPDDRVAGGFAAATAPVGPAAVSLGAAVPLGQAHDLAGRPAAPAGRRRLAVRLGGLVLLAAVVGGGLVAASRLGYWPGRRQAGAAAADAVGGDLAQPGSVSGQATPTCASGWQVPVPRTPLRTEPLDHLRASMGVTGEFVVAEMRFFRGHDGSLWWYVKAWRSADSSFRGRWLVVRQANGVRRVAAVAPYDTGGLRSPDWRAFSGQGAPRRWTGLPGAWRGSPVDFAAADGLPGELRGCLAGT
ncbi:MAG TPA: serine/threonine-protein kinase [Actinomycetes bacterium]